MKINEAYGEEKVLIDFASNDNKNSKKLNKFSIVNVRTE